MWKISLYQSYKSAFTYTIPMKIRFTKYENLQHKDTVSVITHTASICSQRSSHLVHILSKFDLLKVAGSCSACHDCLPPLHIACAQIVGGLEVVWVMTIVTEEERLNDWLIDHCGDDRYPRGVWLSRCLIHHKLRLFVSPIEEER